MHTACTTESRGVGEGPIALDWRCVIQAHHRFPDMRSFQFLRHPSSAASARSSTGASGPNGEFQDTLSEPRLLDMRGWFDSSSDLKCGLQVQEDDFDSLPAEIKAAFPAR